MINEALKKQFLTSSDYFKATRWEGKPLGFKLKYFVANCPELALGCFCFAFIFPLIAAYNCSNYDNNKYKALDKYRTHYTVVRHDDPDIEKIKAEKEFGREHFPKY